MTLPYLKFALVKIPPGESAYFTDPTPEMHAILFGYEPTKINPSYEDFKNNYIARRDEEAARLEGCTHRVEKLAVRSESDITAFEQTDNFVRWL